ncbi:DUF664 domain-containing protein [Nakamurella silvestris]|nr:DUF664 domain-containing protein [Nakamurella silvestris]
MATEDTPWEPPFAGTEGEHLLGALNRLRTTFRWKAGGLDAAGLNSRVGASTLTLGGLLKHLALVEDDCSGPRLSGARLGQPWESGDWESDPRWDFSSAATDSPETLYSLWDLASARSQERFAAALADGGPGRTVSITAADGTSASLRRLLCDLIEEYGRHTGHADLLREQVDGLVGEDPPPGWCP